MSEKIPIYKVKVPIVTDKATLSIGGDWHYGVRGVNKEELITSINQKSKIHKDIIRIQTGDLVENSLKTSVGHNYDIETSDPDIQKREVIDILTKTNKNLYGKRFNSLQVNTDNKNLNNIRSFSIEGNHEYRTRKLTGQWLGKEICEASKTQYLGIQSILELTITNKTLGQRTFKIYIAHRPSKADTTSEEGILRAFRRKQSILPGVDIFVFGHFHKRFAFAGGYFDAAVNDYRKVLYVVNPSPMKDTEYALEAGYPPLVSGISIEVFLPIDPILPIWTTI